MSDPGRNAGLPWVLALQRRWCWREADAGSGLEERTAGPSELLEDRDSGCPGWAALGAGPSIQTLQGLQMREPDQTTAHSLLASSTPPSAETREDTLRSPCTPPPPTSWATLINWQQVQWKETLKSSQPLNW